MTRRKPPLHYWTPERVAEAYRMHMEGESITRIAVRNGMTVASLSIALRNAGLRVRRRGGAIGRTSGTFGPAAHEHVLHEGACVVCDLAVASA